MEKKLLNLLPSMYFSDKIDAFGDVPKWLKGPHSKCGRSGNRREGSNPSISVKEPKPRSDLGFGSYYFSPFLGK